MTSLFLSCDLREVCWVAALYTTLKYQPFLKNKIHHLLNIDHFQVTLKK